MFTFNPSRRLCFIILAESVLIFVDNVEKLANLERRYNQKMIYSGKRQTTVPMGKFPRWLQINQSAFTTDPTACITVIWFIL